MNWFTKSSALIGLLALMIASVNAQKNHAGLAEKASTQFIDVEGARIAYRSFGQGEPIIFLQRYRASMDDWDPGLLDVLATTCRVILFDNAGVGESGGSVQPTLEGAADTTAALIKALGLQKVDVLGWSMGGMTAPILAIKHPELVRKLVLTGTVPPGGSSEIVVSLENRNWGSTATKPTYTDEDILLLFFSPSESGLRAGHSSLARTSKRRPATEMKSTPEARTAQSAAMRGFFKNEGSWYQRLKEIKAPTLVANGDRDPVFPAIDSVILAREIPGAELAIYPDSGHGFLFQYPDRFAADVRSFLDKTH
jgi:pimeloyl-ACP methyl ester carboxylesterase